MIEKKLSDVIQLELAIKTLKARKDGLEAYKSIIDSLHNTNVASDAEGFQKAFNRFFRVRRSAEWRKAFYALLQSKKGEKKLCYADILRELSDKTGNVEASFSSKLLAVCNTDMPIWDSVVISRLGLSPSYSAKREKKIGQTIAKYEEIVSWYKRVLAEKEADEFLARFEKEFPDFKFSDVKKLDFLIWASGKK